MAPCTRFKSIFLIAHSDAIRISGWKNIDWSTGGKMRRKMYGESRVCILYRTGSATGNDTVRMRAVKIVASK